MRLGILSTHPIQYFSPLYAELANTPGVDLTVYFAHRPTPAEQGVGFGVDFSWDIDLTKGYDHRWLANRAAAPGTESFRGCDTPEIAGIVASEGFDAFLVSGWHSLTYWQAMRAGWNARVPVLVRGDSQLRPNGGAREKAKRLLYPLFISRFSACLAVGERSAEYFRHFGARRIVRSPHFVDNERFSSAAASLRGEREAIRREWGLRPDSTIALFAGKLIPKKRPLDFIRAVAAAHGSGVQALIVGDGELRGECVSAARELGIDAVFAGFLNQSQIPRAYAAADLLVLPSDYGETWGLVVNEAMACSLPAVVSDACGCAPDMVVEGQTGFTFPLGDVECLSTRLRELARTGEAVRMGALAGRHALRFNARAAAAGILEAAVPPA